MYAKLLQKKKYLSNINMIKNLTFLRKPIQSTLDSIDFSGLNVIIPGLFSFQKFNINFVRVVKVNKFDFYTNRHD